MSADLGSYSVKNFISFGDEVYFRLFERQFETWWPAHILLLALGAAILALSFLGKTRAVSIALAIPLAVCALTFHFQLYAELTPVGKVFGWAFLLQIPLILLWGFLTKSPGKFRPTIPSITGAVIAALGLIAWPLLILTTDRKATGAETLGMAPDPTICFLLGILLLTARPAWLILLLPIPLLWTFTTAGTLDTLQSPLPMTLPIIAGITILGGIWKGVFRVSLDHYNHRKAEEQKARTNNSKAR